MPQSNPTSPTTLPTITVTAQAPAWMQGTFVLPTDVYISPIALTDWNTFLRAGMVAMQLHNPTHEPQDGPVPPEPQAPEAQTTEQPYSPPGTAGEPTVTYDPQTGAMEVSGDLPLPDTFFDIPF